MRRNTNQAFEVLLGIKKNYGLAALKMFMVKRRGVLSLLTVETRIKEPRFFLGSLNRFLINHSN